MKPIYIRIIVALISIFCAYLLAYIGVHYEIVETWWAGPTNIICILVIMAGAVIFCAAPDSALQEVIDAFKKK